MRRGQWRCTPPILLAEFLNNVRIMDAAAALVNVEFDISATGACRDSWYSSVAELATQNMLGFFCGAADNVLDVGQMVLGMGWATMNCTALLASFGEHGSCRDAKGIAAGVAQLGQAIANCQVGLCDDAAAIVGTMATDIYNRCKEFGYDNCAGYLAVDVADLVAGSHGVGKLDDAVDLATVAGKMDDANDVARVLDDIPPPSAGSWLDDAATARVPDGWGAGAANRSGVGTRWTDPANPGNGIRIDQGNPAVSLTTQQVDHVVVRHNGVVIGRDGSPIPGAIRDYPELAHIPLDEWLTWSEWFKP